MEHEDELIDMADYIAGGAENRVRREGDFFLILSARAVGNHAI